MKPCVVMISANFFPYMGGAEQQALELSKTLQRIGMKVQVLTRRLPDMKENDEVEGVSVLRLRTRGQGLRNSISFMFSCFAWLVFHAKKYQAIHVHLAGSPALSAALAGRFSGKRVIVKVGGGRGIGEIAMSGRTAAGRWKLRLLSWLRPQFVCVTQDLMDEMKERGMRNNGTVVLPNGVDVRRFAPVSSAEKKERRRAAKWPGGLSFLYVGRLAPEKQLGRFLSSFADVLRKTGAEATFSLIGSGPEEEALRKITNERDIESRVLFYPPASDIDKFYKMADIFVLPSISEGLSNALLEAMSSGLAVLASRVGGTREAVQEEVSGLLFDPGKPEEMEAQLKRFLNDPGMAETMGRRAREAALARFDLGVIARKYVKIYGLGNSN